MKKFQLIRAKYYGLSLSGSSDPLNPLKKDSNFYSSYKWLLSRSYVKGALILKSVPAFKFNFGSLTMTKNYMLLRNISLLTLSKFISKASFYYSFINVILNRWYLYLIFLLKIDYFFNKNIK